MLNEVLVIEQGIDTFFNCQLHRIKISWLFSQGLSQGFLSPLSARGLTAHTTQNSWKLKTRNIPSRWAWFSRFRRSSIGSCVFI